MTVIQGAGGSVVIAAKPWYLSGEMASDLQILKKVMDTLSRHHMLERGDGVLVGLSGGPDSVCLLHVLYRLRSRLNIRLAAAHFDHGLRPVEDPMEARFTADLCRSLHIPYEAGQWGVRERQAKGSPEERAREARYRFLAGAREKLHCRRIALGHTLNDQAETVLMRLLRGSGPAGLAGIPPCRDGGIIRPLIETDRTAIEDFLARNDLASVTDSSNAERRFVRNRIRWELLPLLEGYQPDIVRHLGRLARIMREDEEWMDSAAVGWLGAATKKQENGTVEISLSAFNGLPRALKNRIVRQALKTAAGTLRGVDAVHIDAIGRLADGSRPQARLDLPNRIFARRVYDRLMVGRSAESPVEAFSHRLDGPGTCELKGLDRRIRLKYEAPSDGPPRPGRRWTARLDGGRVAFPLTVRNIRPGDRFVPLGMTGHKKVKDFFIDLKVPARDRAKAALLTQGDDILWVCGYRIDDRFKVTPDTREVLRVEIEP